MITAAAAPQQLSSLWQLQCYVMSCLQMLLHPGEAASRHPAMCGTQGNTWIGGTVSHKDSKHKQLKAPVPDGRFRPARAVRPASRCSVPAPNCIAMTHDSVPLIASGLVSSRCSHTLEALLGHNLADQ